MPVARCHSALTSQTPYIMNTLHLIIEILALIAAIGIIISGLKALKNGDMKGLLSYVVELIIVAIIVYVLFLFV